MADHTEPVPASAAPAAGRRRFLGGIIGMIGAAIAGTLGVIFGGFTLSPSVRADERTWVSAGNEADLETDVPKEIAVAVQVKDGWFQTRDHRLVYATKQLDGSLVVLSPVCTHLGCTVSWDQKTKQFHCPCHGGVYDPGGRNVAGPPPRPLARFEARVTDGKLEIRM